MDTDYHVGRLYVKECSLPSEPMDGINLFKAVKMSPFTLVLALDTSVLFHSQNPEQQAPSSSHLLTLANVNIEPSLIFDHPEQKEVAYVKDKPIICKTTVSDNGLEATFEIKLKVLSSQLEDMNFRVKFRALDAILGKEICPVHMVVCSDPIKIISKPEKANKRPRATGKKPTNNHTLLQSLERIHQGLKENVSEMERILGNLDPSGDLIASGNISSAPVAPFPFQIDPPQNNAFSLPKNQPSFLSSLTEQPPSKKQKIDDDRPLDFETSFRDMMKAFESLAPETRSFQMDKFVRTRRITVTELSELHDMLSDGGLGQPIGNPYSQNVTFDSAQDCLCDNCPFKKEYESRNEFMDSLFSLDYN
mmetsp:Transcript_135594/g.201650  ORF Transcript_135594/g.201650 Transcript_135594/m.201650 type:complete len:363 (-) Transcript_135594:1-1089(-)